MKLMWHGKLDREVGEEKGKRGGGISALQHLAKRCHPTRRRREYVHIVRCV